MPKKTRYKKYDLWVKSAISLTGSPDLFPELKISRTTANYWIKEGYTTDGPVVESLPTAIVETKSELKSCNARLVEQEALVKLLKTTVTAAGFQLRWKHVDSSEMKYQILDALAEALVTAPRRACLDLIDQSLSRYKRWRKERRSSCGLKKTNVSPASFVKRPESCAAPVPKVCQPPKTVRAFE